MPQDASTTRPQRRATARVFNVGVLWQLELTTKCDVKEDPAHVLSIVLLVQSLTQRQKVRGVRVFSQPCRAGQVKPERLA